MTRTLLALCCCVMAFAEEGPRTGSFSITFDESSPYSLPSRFHARYGLAVQSGIDQARAIDMAQESFDVYVPPEYDGSVPYGLISWTSSSKGGKCPGEYLPLMNRYKLIWIGAANVPNERDAYERWRLNLDGVHNMMQRYNIDLRRIYCSGRSGGGRCASHIVPGYPDVYTGALYLIGCNNYSAAVGPEARALKLDDLFKTRRFAFMTGSKDYNQADTLQICKAYQAMGVAYAEYFEQPGLGHDSPSAEWFEKGLRHIDGPLVAEAEALAAHAAANVERNPAEAWAASRRIVQDYAFAADQAAAAREQMATLHAAAEAKVGPEAEQLVARGDAAKLRDFVRLWAGLAPAEMARSDAEKLAAAELKAISERGGRSVKSKLEDLRREWAGFEVVAAATDAYDALAAAAFAQALEESDTERRAKAVGKELSDWEDCPAVRAARQRLAADLASLLDGIAALEDPRKQAQGYQGFARQWQGHPAAAEAEQRIQALIKQHQR